jgi:hypothetical protein
MVDNIKLNKVMSALPSASKVKRTDKKSGNEQQSPFEEIMKKKRRKKKKKKDSEPAKKTTDGRSSADDGRDEPISAEKDGEEKSTDFSSKRIIDIRV